MARYPQHVNAVKIDDGHTALHIAAANDHLDVVCLLASLVSSTLAYYVNMPQKFCNIPMHLLKCTTKVLLL